MRLKLIYPDWGHFPLVYRRYIPVMGPAIIAALTPKDVEISFTDERLRSVDTDGDYDLVAISTMTSQANRAYALADAFRARGIPVVMGGVHASVLSDDALRHADSVVIGEAEEVWPSLIEDFRNGTLKRLYRCEKPPTDIPMPRWDIFDTNTYIPMNSIQVSRGCPVNCEMCSVPDTFGTEFRMLDTGKLTDSMKKLQKYLFLVNDNLHLAKRKVRGLLEAMSEMDQQWVGLAPLSFAKDEEYLKLLRKSRCWAMYIDLSPWVSAGISDVIEGVRADKAGEYLKRVSDHGIKVIASFVFGFDHDRKDVFEKTVEFAKTHGIAEVEFHILTPYPKSRLSERLIAERRLLTDDYSKYSTSSVVFRPKNMTVDELYEGYYNAWRYFYSDECLEETEAGPVIKSYACFPLTKEDLLNNRGPEWVEAVLKETGSQFEPA